MKISERANALQETARISMMVVARKAIEAELGSPLPDSEWAEISSEMGDKTEAIEVASAIIGIATALDEWQASIEERLTNYERAALEQSDAELAAVRANIRRGARVTEHRFNVDKPARFEEEKPPTPKASAYEPESEEGQ